MRTGAYTMPAITAVVSMGLGGCAINVPSIGELGASRPTAELAEIDLVNHIKCEIHLAVQRIQEEAARNEGPLGGNSIAWLRDWGAKVNLQVQVNVKSTAAPGISITDPLQNAVAVFPENGNVTIARNHSFGAGLTLGSEITRVETTAYLYAFEDLFEAGPLVDPETRTTPSHASFCGKIDLVEDDDLGIHDFLRRKAMLAALPDALPQKGGGPFEVLSFQVKFIVTKGLTLNPGWKLVRLTVSPSGSFYNGQRVRTNDLTITLGPVKKEDGTVKPSASLNEQHLANLIGRAVADAIREPQ